MKPFFVRTVAILGGESSGKSTLVKQTCQYLQHYQCMGIWSRLCLFHTLAVDEIALQYSDYDKIALGHAQYIDFAVKYANKVAGLSTPILSLPRRSAKKYEGREHPFVQALIDEYRFDLVILLENNTPWVADGLREPRQFGGSHKEFQNLLGGDAGRDNIEFVRVEEDDYDSRFLRCVELVRR